MRLYLFEHCSICFRVRMAAALKRRHLQETVILEDDSSSRQRKSVRSLPRRFSNDGRLWKALVDPSTVQRISRPFDGAGVAA
jgi:glutaredoxin 2